jgi:hypothetical protein
MALPDGFARVVVADRIAICPVTEQAWVHAALTQAAPGTQPSTGPSDLLARLKERQASLVAQMSQQLELPDKQQLATFVVDTLLPLADRLNRLRAKLVYLVITRDDLKRLVLGGWDSAQFHYNRVADKIAFNGNVDVSIDGADGESIVPAIYAASESVNARIANFGAAVRRTETGVAGMIARESESTLQLTLAKFIAQEAIKPLKLNLNQDWFSAGVVGNLSSGFMATISGADAREMVQMLAHPDPRNPVSLTSIDLMNPTKPADLRPENAAAYGDAFRRRSVGVVASIVDRAGPDSLSKILTAIRSTPPADGPALVQLINKTTGLDLTNDLSAQ